LNCEGAGVVDGATWVVEDETGILNCDGAAGEVVNGSSLVADDAGVVDDAAGVVVDGTEVAE